MAFQMCLVLSTPPPGVFTHFLKHKFVANMFFANQEFRFLLSSQRTGTPGSPSSVAPSRTEMPVPQPPPHSVASSTKGQSQLAF